jgi:hypothetical protein
VLHLTLHEGMRKLQYAEFDWPLNPN